MPKGPGTYGSKVGRPPKKPAMKTAAMRNKMKKKYGKKKEA